MQLIRLFLLRIRSYAALNFFIGSLVGIYIEQFVLQFSEQRGWITLFSILLLIALAFVAVPPLDAWLRTIIAGETPPMGEKPAHRQALIVLLSNEETAYNAINYHSERNILRTVLFVVTDRSQALFDKMKPTLTARGLQVRPEYMDDAYDPAEAAAAVNNCVTWALRKGLNLDDMICDVTGGTSIMTVGAAAECQRSQRQIEVQVVKASYDETGRPRPLHPVIVPIAAFGQAAVAA